LECDDCSKVILSLFSMLSLEDCKKYIKTPHTDEEILQIRNSLYQLADIYLENYLKEYENEKKQNPDK